MKPPSRSSRRLRHQQSLPPLYSFDARHSMVTDTPLPSAMSGRSAPRAEILEPKYCLLIDAKGSYRSRGAGLQGASQPSSSLAASSHWNVQSYDNCACLPGMAKSDGRRLHVFVGQNGERDRACESNDHEQ